MVNFITAIAQPGGFSICLKSRKRFSKWFGGPLTALWNGSLGLDYWTSLLSGRRLLPQFSLKIFQRSSKSQNASAFKNLNDAQILDAPMPRWLINDKSATISESHWASIGNIDQDRTCSGGKLPSFLCNHSNTDLLMFIKLFGQFW